MSTASSSTAPTAAVLAMKLVRNSPPDAEMVYDTVFAELMTRFVYEGVDYVANEADLDAMVMPAPAGPVSNANTRLHTCYTRFPDFNPHKTLNI